MNCYCRKKPAEPINKVAFRGCIRSPRLPDRDSAENTAKHTPDAGEIRRRVPCLTELKNRKIMRTRIIIREFARNFSYGVRETVRRFRDLKPRNTVDAAILAASPILFPATVILHTVNAYQYRRHHYRVYCKEVLR